MMTDIADKAIRSVGQLQVGKPDHTHNIFSVDFLFSSKSKTIGEDEIKSASLTVTKEFHKLLVLNGFWRFGEEKLPMPEVMVRPVGPDMVHFICAVRTPPKGPIIVNLPKH